MKYSFIVNRIRNMIKILFIFIICLSIVSCVPKSDKPLKDSKKNLKNSKETSKKSEVVESMDFKSINLSIQGMSAIVDIFEAKMEGDLLKLSAAKRDLHTNDSNVYREIIADSEKTEKLKQLLKRCNVEAWAGFSETDSSVMDGKSFDLRIETEQKKISERGTNKYPENFSVFMKELVDMILTEYLNSSIFETDSYKITIPETWKGHVKVHYTDNGIGFNLVTKTRNYYPFFH